MLIKAADDKSKRLKLLEELQRSDRLDDRQKDWLRQELRRLAPGLAGERDAIHYLDMSFSESKNHVILHDLRLEAEGQVAQIDHLILDRSLTFFLLETKTYSGSLHINDHGEFTVEYSGERQFGIESPLEQSKRHETVLKKVLERLGITGRIGTKPTFVHVVMVHPKGVIQRPDAKAFDSSMVIKADQFATWHSKYLEKFGGGTLIAGLLNARTRNTLMEWGELLKHEHLPLNQLELPAFMKPKAPTAVRPVNAAAQEIPQKDSQHVISAKAVNPEPIEAKSTEVAKPTCAVCGKRLTVKVTKYCQDMAKQFGGKLYCFDHQADAKKA